MEQQAQAGRKAASFNVNALVTGVLVACVLSAIGFSEGDPVVQWYIPAGILLASIAWGLLRPSKPPKNRTQLQR